MNSTFPPIPPEISINDLTLAESNSGTKTASFTVTLSESSTQKVTVQYKTEDGTATAPGDYTAVPLNTLTFNPGQTQKTIQVTYKGDTVAEVDETFFVDLSAAVNGNIVKSRGVCTLTDEEGLSFLSVNDVAIIEGNSGTKTAAFTVTLAPVSTKTITVKYATADGVIFLENSVEPGAQAGSDYVAKALTTLTFTPGQTTKTVNITINGDTTFEPNEPFYVNLSEPTNAEISDAKGLGTITNDDAAPLPTLSINDVNVLEGNSVNFTVTLSEISAQAVTANYATANGSAIAPGDYITKTGTVTIPAGQTRGIINIQTVGETLHELDESFFVNLSAPTNATITDTQGRGIIIDNDSPPAVTIDDVTVTEGNTGTTRRDVHHRAFQSQRQNHFD